MYGNQRVQKRSPISWLKFSAAPAIAFPLTRHVSPVRVWVMDAQWTTSPRFRHVLRDCSWVLLCTVAQCFLITMLSIFAFHRTRLKGSYGKVKVCVSSFSASATDPMAMSGKDISLPSAQGMQRICIHSAILENIRLIQHPLQIHLCPAVVSGSRVVTLARIPCA